MDDLRSPQGHGRADAVRDLLPSERAGRYGGAFGTLDAGRVIDEALSRGVQVVAVKRGELGAIVGTATEAFEVPPYTPAPVVDTTGAGDAFNGGLLHGILQGMSLRDAASLGSIAAGLKIRGRGALTTMPSRDEVYAAFESMA